MHWAYCSQRTVAEQGCIVVFSSYFSFFSSLFFSPRSAFLCSFVLLITCVFFYISFDIRVAAPLVPRRHLSRSCINSIKTNR